MYRETRRYRERCAAMRAAKERRRLAGEPRETAPVLPVLRRRVTIEDFDFGRVVHVVELYRTARVDCYRAVVDGRPWRARIGWSRVLAALRKSCPRVRAA